jgi:Coenzyme PQQ synthesis protein D (PqqD)
MYTASTVQIHESVPWKSIRYMSSRPEPEPTSRVRTRRNVRSQKVDGQLLLLNIKTTEYFALDAVGEQAWEKLSEGASIEETAGSLSELYDASVDQITSDIISLVKALIEHRLIRLRSSD